MMLFFKRILYAVLLCAMTHGVHACDFTDLQKIIHDNTGEAETYTAYFSHQKFSIFAWRCRAGRNEGSISVTQVFRRGCSIESLPESFFDDLQGRYLYQQAQAKGKGSKMKKASAKNEHNNNQ